MNDFILTGITPEQFAEAMEAKQKYDTEELSRTHKCCGENMFVNDNGGYPENFMSWYECKKCEKTKKL